MKLKIIFQFAHLLIHRTAITNARIEAIEGQKVLIEVKKYAQSRPGLPAEKGTLELDGLEFLRRFSQHLLPASLQRIRYFGIYAAAAKNSLDAARKSVVAAAARPIPRTPRQIVTQFLGHDPDFCPCCQRLARWSTQEICPVYPSRKYRNLAVKLVRPPPAPIDILIF